MSLKRYITNNSRWEFPIITVPTTVDEDGQSLNVYYNSKSFSGITTLNLPNLNMSLSVSRGYDTGTIFINGVDTNQSTISNYTVTEDTTITFSEATPRNFSVGYDIYILDTNEKSPDGKTYSITSDQMFVLYYTQTGESLLYDTSISIYRGMNTTPDTLALTITPGTLGSEYVYFTDLPIDSFRKSDIGISSSSGRGRYVFNAVLTGTDDNGNTYTTQSPTYTVNFT